MKRNLQEVELWFTIISEFIYYRLEEQKMRYELEMLEKILYYDEEGVSTRFPLYVYRTKEEVNREALEAAVGYAIAGFPLNYA